MSNKICVSITAETNLIRAGKGCDIASNFFYAERSRLDAALVFLGNPEKVRKKLVRNGDCVTYSFVFFQCSSLSFVFLSSLMSVLAHSAVSLPVSFVISCSIDLRA